jgi:hypothetical protein
VATSERHVTRAQRHRVGRGIGPCASWTRGPGATHSEEVRRFVVHLDCIGRDQVARFWRRFIDAADVGGKPEMLRVLNGVASQTALRSRVDAAGRVRLDEPMTSDIFGAL